MFESIGGYLCVSNTKNKKEERKKIWQSGIFGLEHDYTTNTLAESGGSKLARNKI